MDDQLKKLTPFRTNAHSTSDRRKFTAWMLVVRQNILPLSVAFITVIVFGRLGQVQEALFGTIGLAPPGPNARTHPPTQYIGSQFYALIGTIIMLAVAIWYSSRLLLTVDAATRTRLARMAVRRRATGIVEEFPRVLGAATAAALMVILITAQSGIRANRLVAVIIGVLATFGPFLALAYIARRKPARMSRPAKLLAGVAAATGTCFIINCGLIRLTRPADIDWRGASALAFVCVLPALFYAAVAWRRALLTWAGYAPREASAGIEFTLRQGILRLLCMGFLGGVMLVLLAFGPAAAARTFGSAAIALLAVTACLCVLCALTLTMRRLDHVKPGVVITSILLLLTLYMVLHAAVGWSPFREQTGTEKLAAVNVLPASAVAQATKTPDIVVNAYGGGLRSALFTGQVLAELDDRSCGEFGKRLDRLSGVSGGSLGLAVYLVLRQDLVAANGWAGCTPGPTNPPLLASKVEAVLLQDHLSAALARMLSVDLVPTLTPQRGYALLQSWHDALKSQQTSRELVPGNNPAEATGLALPLRLLNGGLAPAPAVFFNATRVSDGKTIWFSNRGTFGIGVIATPLAPSFQVGQAVLHSSRFPFVSPAGSFDVNSGSSMLVDGGYADNSGAATLLFTDVSRLGRTWLNIDGNPPTTTCDNVQRKSVQGVFSGFDTLLAVRRSQAALAVERFSRERKITGIKLVPDLEEAFRSTIMDHDKRCQRIMELRNAPLGWYLTPVTAGDQRLGRLAAVSKACEKLKPLCGG